MSRILVVDDDRNILRSIKRIFMEECGYELKYSDNGYDAIQLAEDFSPDVILLDVMMSDMNGYEVCQKIKSNAKTSEIMVLFLSGKFQLDDRMKGYEALADDYITKPFDNEELIAKVRILLRLKRAQDELRKTNYDLEKIVEQQTRQLVIAERQAVVGRMVQGIVHNFRNPLMAAQGFTNFIEKRVQSLLPYSMKWPVELQQEVKNVSEDVKHVLEALARIGTLLDSLMQKGRRDSTNKYQKLNLNDIIASEVTFLEADPNFKNKVKKQFDQDPQLPEFFGNYADFSQLCGNMINNAVDSMLSKETKVITLCTKHDAENIYIDFTDTGEGISPQIIDQIFEPFFSTKALSCDEKEGEPTGSGLGLYSCQQLMKVYNGNITVSSKLQVGTTFTVTLPYTENCENGRISTYGGQSF